MPTKSLYSMNGYCECLFSFKSNNASRSDIFALANYIIKLSIMICKFQGIVLAILKFSRTIALCHKNVCGYSTKLQFDLFIRSRYKAVAESLLD